MKKKSTLAVVLTLLFGISRCYKSRNKEYNRKKVNIEKDYKEVITPLLKKEGFTNIATRFENLFGSKLLIEHELLPLKFTSMDQYRKEIATITGLPCKRYKSSYIDTGIIIEQRFFLENKLVFTSILDDISCVSFEHVYNNSLDTLEKRKIYPRSVFKKLVEILKDEPPKTLKEYLIVKDYEVFDEGIVYLYEYDHKDIKNTKDTDQVFGDFKASFLDIVCADLSKENILNDIVNYGYKIKNKVSFRRISKSYSFIIDSEVCNKNQKK